MNLRLEPYWKQLTSMGVPTDPPPAIAPDRLAEHFAQLPLPLSLPPEVRTWYDVGDQTEFNGWEYGALSYATHVRGASRETHENRRKRLAELMPLTGELGYRLPADFVTFLESDDYVSRLRIGCQSISLPDFLRPCPLAPDCLMFLFLIEEQGCNYTHLLLTRDGSHCVTRSGYAYGQDPRIAGPAPADRWISLLADSFAEFVCRESEEVREYERGLPAKLTQLGDAARDAGDRQSALDFYRIALCHDPGAEAARRRIAELGGSL